MTRHKGLINSDVSFNKLLWFSCNEVREIQGHMDQKLNRTNLCANI